VSQERTIPEHRREWTAFIEQRQRERKAKQRPARSNRVFQKPDSRAREMEAALDNLTAEALRRERGRAAKPRSRPVPEAAS